MPPGTRERRGAQPRPSQSSLSGRKADTGQVNAPRWAHCGQAALPQADGLVASGPYFQDAGGAGVSRAVTRACPLLWELLGCSWDEEARWNHW